MSNFLTKLKAFFTQPLFTPRRTEPPPATIELTPPPMPQPLQSIEATLSPLEPQAQPVAATIDAPSTTLPVQAPVAIKPVPAPTEQKLPTHYIRVDKNIDRASLFTVSTDKRKSRTIEVFIDSPDGTPIAGKLTIGLTDKGVEVGQLKPFDGKVFYTLIDFWERAGRPIEKPIICSLGQLSRSLHIPNSGRSFSRIKHALYALHDTPLHWEAYYNADNAQLERSIAFHLVSDIDIKKRTQGERVTAGITYKLHDRFTRNLLQSYTHPILLDTALSFRKDLAFLLYSYIDRRLACTNCFEETLTNLWNGTLGLPSNYIRYPVDRKTKLTPAFNELKGKPLSTGILADIQVIKNADGTDYKAIFTKAARAGALTPKPKKPRQPRLKLTTPKPLNDPALIDHLTRELTTQLEDVHSERYYHKVATYCPQDLIIQLIKTVNADYKATDITKSKGAIFTDLLKRHPRTPHYLKQKTPPAVHDSGGNGQT